MTWTTPKIVEVCVAMEVTSYEFRRNLGWCNRDPLYLCGLKGALPTRWHFQRARPLRLPPFKIAIPSVQRPSLRLISGSKIVR